MRLHRAAWYEVPHWWPAVAAWMENALARSLVVTADDLYSDCLSRRAVLWLALDGETPRGACVTQIDHHRDASICTAVALGGVEMQNWLAMREGIENYARAEGCRAMEAFGRRGWERVLPDYEPVHVVYRKVL